MKTDWITAKTACALLGVRAQTLYAYASRKGLRVARDPQDSRRSLYARQDVEMLARQNRRPRARADIAAESIAWGAPVLKTAISGLRDGALYFRDAPALDLCETHDLEGIAAHHLDVQRWPQPHISVDVSPVQGAVMQRGLQALTAQAVTAPPLSGRAIPDTLQDASDLLHIFSHAITGAGSGPAHHRLAQLWGITKTDADHLRRALVLMSDHELNPSTFAVRVAASTGASLAACALAGMATLTGPKHGGVANKTLQALRAAMRGTPQSFLQSHPDLSPYSFGFGHPLYPRGDPRAQAILNALPPNTAAVNAALRLAQDVGAPPNIDSGLAALSLHFDLPDDAPFALFALGRITGWMAHAVEQAISGTPIRPRAEFSAK